MQAKNRVEKQLLAMQAQCDESRQSGGKLRQSITDLEQQSGQLQN